MKKKLNGKFRIRNSLAILLAIGLLSLTTAGCNKDDDGPVTTTSLLTAAPWKFSSVDTGDAAMDALFSQLFQGMTMTFSTDGTYTIVLPSDPSESSGGTWELTNNENSILFDKGTGEENVVDINQLGTDILGLKFVENEPGVGETIVNVTFTH